MQAQGVNNWDPWFGSRKSKEEKYCNIENGLSLTGTNQHAQVDQGGGSSVSYISLTTWSINALQVGSFYYIK